MQISLISSPLSWREVEKQLQHTNALALDPEKIKNAERIQLANVLAQQSFNQKKNLSKQFRFEFLLWLAGTGDIKNALQKFGAKNPKNMLLVVFANESSVMKNFKAKKKKLILQKKATWQEVEAIALSRIY